MSGAEAERAGAGVGRLLGFPAYTAAEQALRHTLHSHPGHLASYVDLCKLYFYSSRLAEAERVARAALMEAARQGGFAPDWCYIEAVGAAWKASDGPHRVYLYMLKALAFIRMRLGDVDGGRAILGHLARLDPEDLVGSSVVSDLAEALP